MWWVFATEFVLLGVVMAVSLRRFASKRTAWHVYLTVWFSWTVALAIVWIVPLDIFYVLRRRCEADMQDNCPRVVLNDVEGDEGALNYMWKTVYWSCQIFGWVILTMQQSYIDAGQFTFGGRMWQALKENLILIAVGGVVVASFVTYLAVVHHMDVDSVIPVLMAVTNCFGLLIVILLLSYGLVELPRAMWHRAFLSNSLMRAESDAVMVMNKLDDAKAELALCLSEVRSASNAVREGAPTYKYIEIIVQECPQDLMVSSSEARDGERDDPDPLAHSMARLIVLRRRLNRAVVQYRKAKTTCQTAIEWGLLLQDIVKARNEASWHITSDLRPPRTGKYARSKNRIEYLWLVHLKPLCLGILAIGCGLLSVLLLVSEVVLLPAIGNAADSIWGRSPLAYLVHRFGLSDVSVLLLVFIPLSYACVTVYFSLFRLKIFNIYEVVPFETDDVSLLFTGYFITRLVPAICYNFLNLLGETHEVLDENQKSQLTVFEQNFKAMGTVPLLGDSYNNWLPPIIIVFCLGTLANVGSKCLRLCNVNRFQFTGANDDQVQDGRVILQEERRNKLRPDAGNRPVPVVGKKGFAWLVWRVKRTFRRAGDEGTVGGVERPGAQWGNQWQKLQDEINTL